MIHFIIALVCFLGLIAGWFIAKFTKQELKDGKNYFILLNKVLVILLIVSLLYSNFNIYALIVGLVVGFFVRNSFLYLGLIVGDFLTSSLVLLFNLSYSAIKPFSKKVLILSLSLFIVGFLIANFYKTSIFFSFSAGALIWRLNNALFDKFRIV